MTTLSATAVAGVCMTCHVSLTETTNKTTGTGVRTTVTNKKNGFVLKNNRKNAQTNFVFASQEQ